MSRIRSTHPSVRHEIAELRRGGYTGPAFLRGRPAYEYMARHRPSQRALDAAA